MSSVQRTVEPAAWRRHQKVDGFRINSFPAGDGYIHPGTGYNESQDGGNTWLRPDEGLKHNYLVSVAVDPADPNTIVVSAAASPAEAHSRFNAQSFIYRKQDQTPWQRISKGLPEAKGMIVPVLATNNSEPHVFYARTNKALYRSPDAGQYWEQINIPWKREYQGQHPQADSGDRFMMIEQASWTLMTIADQETIYGSATIPHEFS